MLRRYDTSSGNQVRRQRGLLLWHERNSFDIDVDYCPHCGRRVKIIAAIDDSAVIAKILPQLNLPGRAPPRSAAQAFDLFQAG
jgi:hypothetical protein